jgi:hypothetical protein
MTTHVRLLITAAVVGLGMTASAHAQMVGTSSAWRATAPARVDGSITSVVKDAGGSPVAGAIVSAVGRRTVTGTTDVSGRCTINELPAGEYLVRVHRAGYSVGHSLVIRVRPGLETSRSFVLRRSAADRARAVRSSREEVEVLAAGFVGTAGVSLPGDVRSLPDDVDPETQDDQDHDHGEVSWRLRHLPRNVLKEAVAAAAAEADDEETPGLFGRAMSAPARAAVALFADAPLTGQFNLLTTSTFDSPDQFLSDATLARGVAYVSVGSAAGDHGDWSVQGALTQGDVASWAIATSFIAHPRARHRYQTGMTYAVQRYTGHNPDALSAVADGTRNAGTVFAYDTWTLNGALTVMYGARYARYGYVDGALFSPRARVEIRPLERVSLAFTAGRQEEAPGAEEFLPSGMPGPWLPPELTFSPLSGDRVVPERTEHYQVAIEHRLGRTGATAVGLRAFRQHTDDQMATIFGLGPVQRTPAELGHYYVASAGDVLVRGWGVSLSRTVAEGIRGSVDYRVSTAHWEPSSDEALIALALPSLSRNASERLHDVTTSIETQIPQTATRVFALYRISTAPPVALEETSAGPIARFDVRVTQSLPFLDFTNAQWEMLVGVRTLFREMLAEGSVYDELLVVRPPKRVVGGLTVRF